MTPGKRALDLAASGVALTLFAPVLATAAALIRLEDGGPVLFLQERVGERGRPFRIVKLRTMRDERVTRVGRWLRATGIDEVPQFVNVLKGDMSVVGPRPLTRADLERLGWAEDPVRSELRPGITGPAQIRAGGPAASLAADHAYVPGLAADVGLIAISFAMNVLGKQRVRGWLPRSGLESAHARVPGDRGGAEAN